MLKKTITYEDFNGVTRTEDFYFHLSKAELLEMELINHKDGGMTEVLQNIIKEEDGQKIVDTFKMLILGSYGQKSPDGREFIKNEALKTSFAQTEAYSQLFIELGTEAEKGAEFIRGIVPSDLQQSIDEELKNSPEPAAVAPPAEKAKDDVSDEDLLKMSAQDMSNEQLQRAFKLKAQQSQPKQV